MGLKRTYSRLWILHLLHFLNLREVMWFSFEFIVPLGGWGWVETGNFGWFNLEALLLLCSFNNLYCELMVKKKSLFLLITPANQGVWMSLWLNWILQSSQDPLKNELKTLVCYSGSNGNNAQPVLAVDCHVTLSYLVMNNHDSPYANLFPPSLNDNGLLNIFFLLTCYFLQCQIFKIDFF